MSDFECTEFITARKKHTCDGCSTIIDPGTQYYKSAWATGGDFGWSKLCLACQALVGQIMDNPDYYCGDGFNSRDLVGELNCFFSFERAKEIIANHRAAGGKKEFPNPFTQAED